MAKIKEPKKIRKTGELLILTSALLIVLLLWDTYFIYPIKLFVVLLHELSHAVVAIITSGTVKEIEIGFDLGGKINAEGGNEIAICSAGYIGSLLIGLALFLSADKIKYGKYFFFFLASVVLITLLNTSPTLNFVLLSILVMACLVVFGIYIQSTALAIFVKVIALSCTLYVLIDIKDDVFSKNISSDAHILSNITGLNDALIGIVWLAISLLALLVMVKFVYFRNNK